jgi:uncharacterized protein with PQ loop repeat
MIHKYEWIGFIAAIAGVLSYYSLVYHNYVLQNTASLSFIWLIVTLLLQILWFIFGMANKIRPTILAAPLVAIGATYLIYLKLKLDTDIL